MLKCIPPNSIFIELVFRVACLVPWELYKEGILNYPSSFVLAGMSIGGMFKEEDFRNNCYEEASGVGRGVSFREKLVGSCWCMGNGRCQGILWKDKLRTWLLRGHRSWGREVWLHYRGVGFIPKGEEQFSELEAALGSVETWVLVREKCEMCSGSMHLSLLGHGISSLNYF